MVVSFLFLYNFFFQKKYLNNNYRSVGVGSEDHPIILRSANECKNIKGLTKKQIKFCKKNLDAMTSVARGAIEAYSECQYQFKGRRYVYIYISI